MIGIFDSGIGGLSVVKEILQLLPAYRVLYFGDTVRTPYGNRSRETIVKYSLEDAEFLLENGAKVIVVGCNSASAAAAEELRRRFSDVPIIEVISPAARAAARATKNGRIGVIGTRATVGSGAYEKAIKESNPQTKVFSASCPLLVPLVEEGWLKKPETKTIVKKYLSPLKVAQADTLIMGCTHYPFLEKTIQLKIGKKVKLIDPGREAALELKNLLENNPELERSLAKDDRHRFFASDPTPRFAELARRWLGRPVELSKAEVGGKF
jgi:glutamate racemase